MVNGLSIDHVAASECARRPDRQWLIFVNSFGTHKKPLWPLLGLERPLDGLHTVRMGETV